MSGASYGRPGTSSRTGRRCRVGIRITRRSSNNFCDRPKLADWLGYPSPGSTARHIQIDRHVFPLREAVRHAFQRKLAANPALFVTTVGMTRLLPKALIDLDP